MTQEAENASDRRGFFRHAMARLVQPIAELVENIGTARSDPARLRPPGAIDEATFLDTCFRCDQCAKACPADAIFLLDRTAGTAAGTPVIDPDRAPCVVCDGLQCTQVCESGALVKLTDPRRIRIGLAEVYEPLCLRTQGESCTVCVDRCPMGTDALRFEGDGPPIVYSSGCVGCGVCQNVCPTTPKAIVVRPSVR
ncbi:MAG: 4Fe-4S dicluster domain-containing protein [Planctomycetes bacterium]|nr:4Fe-4S dicluster domain-containing protein [Planctomycetota bacterium]